MALEISFLSLVPPFSISIPGRKCGKHFIKGSLIKCNFIHVHRYIFNIPYPFRNTISLVIEFLFVSFV